MRETFGFKTFRKTTAHVRFFFFKKKTEVAHLAAGRAHVAAAARLAEARALTGGHRPAAPPPQPRVLPAHAAGA